MIFSGKKMDIMDILGRNTGWIITLIAGVLGLGFIGSFIFRVYEWQNVALVRLGKIIKIIDTPGLKLKIPFIDDLIHVDKRAQTNDLSGQKAITKDNISISIDAVVFTVVENPRTMIMGVDDYSKAVNRFSLTAIRNIVGQYELDDLLENQEEVAGKLKEEIDNLVKEWGIDVQRVGIQDISLPEDMKRAFAVQAEAQRESSAVLIKARAEKEASELLVDAAKKMQDTPGAMQLRILSTINDVSKDQSNTIILALPLDTIRGLNVAEVAALANLQKS